MITIRNWEGLKPYGIDCLTGEACGYGYRVLCDLEPRGIKLIAACLGIDAKLFQESLPDNWNSRAIKSIMLAPQLLTPLAVFAMFEANCSKVYIMYDNSVVGMESSDASEDVAMWLHWNQGKFCEECHRYGKGGGVMFQYTNSGFSRHQHQMSGRTE